MLGAKEIVQTFARELAALDYDPFWASIHERQPGGELVPWSEVWVNVGFDDWEPHEALDNIVAVTAGVTAPISPLRTWRRDRSGQQPARSSRRGRRAEAYWTQGKLICAVSRDGEAYAMWLNCDGEAVQGAPDCGRLLDMMRWKLSLPPGPESAHDLEFAGLFP